MNDLVHSVPTRASLRKLIEVILKLDEHFDAFCIDHFPNVARELSAGMLRSAKLNVLLSLGTPKEILASLRNSNSQEVREHEECLEWELLESIVSSPQGVGPACAAAVEEGTSFVGAAHNLALPAKYASAFGIVPHNAASDGGESTLRYQGSIFAESINNVLFDIYYPQHEPYYIQRALDSQFGRAIDVSSVWVCGPSGYGKTSAIRRWILRSDSRLVGVFLSNAVNCTARELMAALYVELCDALGEPLEFQPTQWSNAVANNMSEMLTRHARLRSVPLSIYVDEIPADSSVVYAEFVRRFIAYLIVHSSKYPPPHPRYILSSIHSPIEHIGMSQQKIRERLQIMRVDSWAEAEMRSLIDVTCTGIGIALDPHAREVYLEGAAGSPRMLKLFLKRMAITADRGYCDPAEIVAEELIAHGVGGR